MRSLSSNSSTRFRGGNSLEAAYRVIGPTIVVSPSAKVSVNRDTMVVLCPGGVSEVVISTGSINVVPGNVVTSPFDSVIV
jgi:hypothetical protein